MTAALIGIFALCMTGCGSSREVTRSNEQLRVLTQESEQVKAERVELARDTLKEVTTVTVQLNEVGDTVMVSTVTDRTRARTIDRAKEVEVKLVEKTDTVYVAVRDSETVTTASPPSASKSSPLVSALKWIFWIIVSVTVFIIVFKVTRVFH